MANVHTPPRRAKGTRAGFTLAEVVVGILIFGMAAAVIGRAVSDALNAYSLSRIEDATSYPMHRVRLHVLAIPSRDQLEEGGEVEVPVAIRDDEADTDRTEMVRAKWEAEILPTRIMDLFVLELKVNLQLEGNDARVIEETYTVYRPPWSDSEEAKQLLEAKEEEFKERLDARGITEDEEEGS